MNQSFAHEAKDKTVKVVHSRTASQLSENSMPNEQKDKEAIRTLGGCSIVEEVRGIQRPQVPEPCQKCLSNLTAPPLTSIKLEEDEEKW